MEKHRGIFIVLTVFTAALFLLSAPGCKPSPATITGSAGFLNYGSSAREFPPTGHSGDLSDDVLYVRLVDDTGGGAEVWSSGAVEVGEILAEYVYDPDTQETPTGDSGVFLHHFVIELTDDEIDAAVMPMRLEAYLYDQPTLSNPGSDGDIYTPYLIGTTIGSWCASITIAANEIKSATLTVQPNPSS